MSSRVSRVSALERASVSRLDEIPGAPPRPGGGRRRRRAQRQTAMCARRRQSSVVSV